MTGSYYANEPIIAEVSLGSEVLGATMVQGVVKVNGTYEFSAAMKWGNKLNFDISSVARVMFASEELNPTDKRYSDGKTLKYKTGVRYLLNGDEVEVMNSEEASLTVYRGGRSEMERYMSVSDIGPSADAKSVKPKEWETINKGDVIICGNGSFEKKDEEKKYITGTGTFMGRNIYVEDNPLRRLFAFENHLGFIESVSCMMRDSKSYKISSDDRYRTYAPSATVNSSLFAKKSGGRAIWKMSSGFVTRAWAEWFATEFLMSSNHWLKINDKWLPVSVKPDGDTTTVYDESKGELTAINFTVTSGIKGVI